MLASRTPAHFNDNDIDINSDVDAHAGIKTGIHDSGCAGENDDAADAGAAADTDSSVDVDSIAGSDTGDGAPRIGYDRCCRR